MWTIGAIVWGALSAQFLVQTICSFAIAAVYLYGLIFSGVKKNITAWSFAAAISQALLFAGFLVGGFWLIASYAHPSPVWNMSYIAGLVAFVFSFIYCFVHVSDRIYIARLCALTPFFAERARFLVPNRAMTANEARKIAAEIATRAPYRPPVSILKSGIVDGMAYTLYSDGSIEAQLPQGTLRFSSIAELRNHTKNKH